MAVVNDRSPLLGPRALPGEHDDDRGNGLHTNDKRRHHQPAVTRRTSAVFTIREPSREPSRPHRGSRYLQAAHDRVVRDNAGLLILLLSAFLISAMALSYTLLVRVTAGSPHPVTPFQVIFARMIFTWMGSVAALYISKDPNPVLGPPGVRLLLCLRGIIGFFGLFST